MNNNNHSLPKNIRFNFTLIEVEQTVTQLPHSQIPACGITEQGSSKLFTLHTVLVTFSESMTDSWFRYSKILYQFIKPLPVIASAL